MELYKMTPTGEDPLGNPITALSFIAEVDGRFSSWTSEEIALDNRDVTANNRKIITTAKASVLKTAEKVRFQGSFYDVTDIKGDDLQRWRILIVKRYGSDAV